MTIRRELALLIVGMTLLTMLLPGADAMFNKLVLALMMVLGFFFSSK